MEVRRPSPEASGPNALLTPFGWCLVGRHPTADTTRAGQGPQVNTIQVNRVQDLEQAVDASLRRPHVLHGPGRQSSREAHFRRSVLAVNSQLWPTTPDARRVARAAGSGPAHRLGLLRGQSPRIVLLRGDCRLDVRKARPANRGGRIRTGAVPQFLSKTSQAILERLPADARLNPELDMDLDGLPTERELGYLWNSQIDAFVFRLQSRPEVETKRTILAAVSSISWARRVRGVNVQDYAAGHLAPQVGFGRQGASGHPSSLAEMDRRGSVTRTHCRKAESPSAPAKILPINPAPRLRRLKGQLWGRAVSTAGQRGRRARHLRYGKCEGCVPG